MYGTTTAYVIFITVVGFWSGRLIGNSESHTRFENVLLALVWTASILGTLVIYAIGGGNTSRELTWRFLVAMTALLFVVPCVPFVVTYSQVKVEPLGKTLKRYGFVSGVTVLTVAGAFFADSVVWRAATVGVVFTLFVVFTDAIKKQFVGYNRTDELENTYHLGAEYDGRSVRTVPTAGVAVEALGRRSRSRDVYVSRGFRDSLSPETQRSLVSLELCRAQDAFREKKQLLLGLPLVVFVVFLPNVDLISGYTAIVAVTMGAYYALIAPRLIERMTYRFDERTGSRVGRSALKRALKEYENAENENRGRSGSVFGPTYRERWERLSEQRSQPSAHR